MTVPDPGRGRLVGTALLTGVLVAIAFVTFNLSRLFLAGGSPDGVSETVLGVLTWGTVSTAWFVPFLLAVLLVLAGPSPRTVATGAVLVYVFDLLLTVSRTFLSGGPHDIELVILAVPLPVVVNFLAVATAVWLAYWGGYERLVAATGNMDQHPLFAVVADEQIGPNLSLQRGLVVAGLAALVGAGGLVLAGGIGDILRAVARSGVSESSTTIIFFNKQVWNVGIALARLPVHWLFEASFLLAVLFVTGPRLWPRDLLEGMVVIFGVQSMVTLLPALVSPNSPVELWDSSGPLMAPLGDATLFVAIAVAVWLAFHGGLETLQNPTSSIPVQE